MSADVLRSLLVTRVLDLHEDELRVLLRIADRLADGQHRYGILRLETDRRDWDNEARAEALDLAVYMACALERRP